MKNSFWSLLSTFSTQGIDSIFFIILGNLFLKEEYGAYVALMLIVNYGANLLTLEIQHGIVKKLHDTTDPGEKNAFFSAGLIIYFAITILTIGILSGFHRFFINLLKVQEYDPLFLWIIPLVSFQLVIKYLNAVLQAHLQIKKMGLLAIASSLIRFIVFASFFFAWKFRIPAIIIGNYAANLFLIGTLWHNCRRFHRLGFRHDMFGKIWELLAFSLQIVPSSICGFLDKRIDMFIVVIYLSKEQVAVYSIATQLALMMFLFGNSISQVNFPKLAKAYAEKKIKQVHKIYSDSLSLSFAVLSITYMAILFHLKPLLLIILPKYLDVIRPLTILVVLFILSGSFNSVGTIFTSIGKPLLNAPPIFIGLIINVFLNLYLIPKIGLIGAAIATGSSYVLRFIILNIIIEKRVHTMYPYARLIAMYILFVNLVFLGMLHQNYWLRESSIIFYIVCCFFYLLTKDQRHFVFKYIYP
jgi:O-antigen/teichoic acid export membrane protein